jgi:hypothetical protein
MSIRFLFAWYDIWVGVFVDQGKRRIYVFPLPCIGFVIQLPEKPDPLAFPKDKTHIDDWIGYGAMNDAPDEVVWWFHLQRLPATLRWMGERMSKCGDAVFATYEGQRVRVVMASRLGDVGITTHLEAENGYEKRVFIDDLTELSTKP